MSLLEKVTGAIGVDKLAHPIEGLPADVFEALPDRKILIKERIGAELVKLMGLEVDEKFLQGQTITNANANKMLAMNKAQQEGIRRYVKFLIEQLK